jgi:dihydroxy-acid dehydratase
VKERRIDLLVEDAELKKRAAVAKYVWEEPERGYAKLYAQEILGADDGCDFAFLRPGAAPK